MRPQEGECGQADLLRTSSTVIRDADKAMKITNVGPRAHALRAERSTGETRLGTDDLLNVVEAACYLRVVE
jgi:hypothetical protein